MTKLSVAGMRSCATMSISGFKDSVRSFNGNGFPNEFFEKEFMEGKCSYKEEDYEGNTVQEFFDLILAPTDQKLGETKDYPFSILMQEIEDCCLEGKTIFASLNAYQQNAGFWPERLKAHGFVNTMRFGNDWGVDNYLYVRSPLNKDIATGKKQEVTIFDV